MRLTSTTFLSTSVEGMTPELVVRMFLKELVKATDRALSPQ